jgi:CelD/BcsL family acetyltransferase involved in cellulose biosynthesis
MGCTIVLPLDGYRSSEDLIATRSRKSRYNLRREERMLARDHGPVAFKIFGRDEAQTAMAELDRFFPVLNQYWVRRGFTAPVGDSAARFYRALVRRALPPGILHLSVLKTGEESISWQIGFVKGRRFLSYIPGFDTRFEQYSPGVLHFLRLLDWAIQNGCSEFDLLRGEEAYKYQWPVYEKPLFSYEAYVCSWRSARAKGIGFLRSIWRLCAKEHK